MMGIFRAIGGWLSPAGSRARLSILIYHRVCESPDPIFPHQVTRQTFDQQMRLLSRTFNVIPLPEAILRLQAGTLPARAACITFDDGYADNVEIALPILKRHRLHATFFIATRYLNGGWMFNDIVTESIRQFPGESLDLEPIGLGRHETATVEQKRKAILDIIARIKYLPPDERDGRAAGVRETAGVTLGDSLMMTSGQLRKLFDAGMEIGGHTHSHPILARLGAEEAEQEIRLGKQILESELGHDVRLFAYPNGKPNIDYLPPHVDLVRKAGFLGAVSTSWGGATSPHDIYQLPRFTPWVMGTHRFIPMMLMNLLRRQDSAPDQVIIN